jgi:putative spermidine/putrescine transport system permease protein
VTAHTSPIAAARPSASRRFASWLHAHSRIRLALLLSLPILWLIVAYLGSLFVLLLNSLWSRDAFTGLVTRTFTLDNFVDIVAKPLYRTVAWRTIWMAALVTVTCAVLAFPIAYYMARVAGQRLRGLLLIAVLTPLWASYLIKAYSWRLILSEEGVLNWLLHPLGLRGPGLTEVGLWLVFTYLWLPYMILPLYAGLERIPSSVLEASADLGGRGWMTFRRIILPLVIPALAAGSIFTFSLTLGDYIAPGLITKTQFIGNVIYLNFGAPDLPFAAALSIGPLVVMVVYLLIARRLGAFEAL